MAAMGCTYLKLPVQMPQGGLELGSLFRHLDTAKTSIRRRRSKARGRDERNQEHLIAISNLRRRTGVGADNQSRPLFVIRLLGAVDK